jgi:hypothetical protein
MIYDGFIEYGVNLIDVRHEQAAVMMAPMPGPCIQASQVYALSPPVRVSLTL